MIDRDIDAERQQLIQAALPHVAFDGWSWAALYLAAEDLGLDREAAVNAFPEGPVGAVELFSTEADQVMLAAAGEHDLAAMKVRERIALTVRLRLEQNASHKEAIRRALSFLALPQHAVLATRLLYGTVDAVWAAAGDTSDDFNFYSKRLLLAGVYTSTLLYWLEDKSEENAATWAFLDRRLAEALRLGGTVGKSLGQLKAAPSHLRRLAPERRPRGRRGLGEAAS